VQKAAQTNNDDAEMTSDPIPDPIPDLTEIPHIGPATARALIAAGIPDAASLRRIGGHEAYRALLIAGERPHFIGYYVLQMGLQGRPWNDCRGDEKAALRRDFDALVAATRTTTPTGIEAALREIGLIAPQPSSRS
jgi:DNA transformation protein